VLEGRGVVLPGCMVTRSGHKSMLIAASNPVSVTVHVNTSKPLWFPEDIFPHGVGK